MSLRCCTSVVVGGAAPPPCASALECPQSVTYKLPTANPRPTRSQLRKNRSLAIFYASFSLPRLGHTVLGKQPLQTQPTASKPIEHSPFIQRQNQPFLMWISVTSPRKVNRIIETYGAGDGNRTRRSLDQIQPPQPAIIFDFQGLARTERALFLGFSLTNDQPLTLKLLRSLYSGGSSRCCKRITFSMLQIFE